MRKIKEETKETEDLEVDQEDDFDKIYKGEISKSGAAILPSKRVRRMPEKISAVKDKIEEEEEKKDTKESNEEAEIDSASAENKTEK